MGIKKYNKVVEQIVELSDSYRGLSDEELRGKTVEFKSRLSKGETLDGILAEAFAVVREAAGRTVGMRHFPVQLLGGIVLHNGDIAEMNTGEGKTLVATLPAYLNALAGKGVYVVTVNDYLAKRDFEQMGKIYKFLGLTVGLVVSGISHAQRSDAYNADITYGTNNEFGFDYLRDNMAVKKEDQVQRGLHFAIIDEVDSVLIDEARTPLIISSNRNDGTKLYRSADAFVKSLTDDDYDIDEKLGVAMLTEDGVAKAERYFHIENYSDQKNESIVHKIHQSLHANVIMEKDVDYVVKDNEIIIVDIFTGRLMNGRRFSNGLHQAIEAKEGVEIKHESKTIATITLQNYFRMFDKLAGMTGTASTDKEEFRSVYNLDVITIPTNRPNIRLDMKDRIYRSEDAKFKAVVQDIKERHKKGQPVLVGTVSIEKSELLSRHLQKEGIEHNVLNAKHLEREAEIISGAGRLGAVTISTNMAGRGTDISLGEGVAEIGGLHVIGTERHESQRIDNQLRGRAARQGDPGSTQFFLSLEDNIILRFGSEQLKKRIECINSNSIEPLVDGSIIKRIAAAQKQGESHNFSIRKSVLQYDNVMNRQRNIIYNQRQQVLKGEGIHEQIVRMTDDVVERLIDMLVSGDEQDISEFDKVFKSIFGRDVIFDHSLTEDELRTIIKDFFNSEYSQKLYLLGDCMQTLERRMLLRSIDAAWMDHIDDMDHLRMGIGLRSYGQNDPVKEYVKEGFQMFDNMNVRIITDTVRRIYSLHLEPSNYI